MLTRADSDTAAEFKAALIAQRVPVVEAMVFGSRARGDLRPDSDLDICLILERVDDAILATISDVAWEVGFAHERIIVTVEYTTAQLASSPVRVSPLVRAIQAEGVPV